MEAAPLFLLLLLPPADTTGDLAAGVQASIRHELGDVAIAVAPSTLVTPAMWQGEKARMRARFIARVDWPTQDKAKIELFLPDPALDPGRPVPSRELTFSPKDSKSERGRAVGLVLAELLREMPGSAFTDSAPGVAATKGGSTRSDRLGLGALAGIERARSGNWAVGPVLTYALALSPGWSLQAAGSAAFGSADSYLNFGLGLGLRWDFLRSDKARLGAGLGADLLRESASTVGEHGGNDSKWDPGLTGALAARVTVWRSLRLVAVLQMRALWRSLSLRVGEERRLQSNDFSRWRPGLSLGFEFTL